jgi:hypothetical protein
MVLNRFRCCAFPVKKIKIGGLSRPLVKEIFQKTWDEVSWEIDSDGLDGISKIKDTFISADIGL